MSFDYNAVFFMSFVGVIGMLVANVIWVSDGHLYYIALAVNLAYGFMTFVRLVTAAKRHDS
ncbi:MAG: hypothetical protein VW779_05460 [Halieaceae bacterium]